MRHVRRNCLSSSWRLNSSDVGRPCGQWWRVLGQLPQVQAGSAISSGVSRSPAFTAALHAIVAISRWSIASRVGGRSFVSR